MAAPQCIPTKLCRAEDGTYCTRHHYLTEDPIAIIKEPGYFLRVRDRLRVGDTILITRVLAGRVRDRFELLVAELPVRHIEFRLLGEILSIPALEVEEPEPEPVGPQYVNGECVVRWNIGYVASDGTRGIYDVVSAAGIVVAKDADKGIALQIAQGDIPIPEQQRPEAA